MEERILELHAQDHSNFTIAWIISEEFEVDVSKEEIQNVLNLTKKES